MNLEAVQFRDWRPWHAVQPDSDRTFCGIQVFGAKRMWQPWGEQVHRCKQCVYVIRAKELYARAKERGQ